MKKSRFDIISDLFKLSNVISGSLKLAESLADKSSGSDETDCKDICRNIRYNLKPLSFLLAGIREYVTEHEDKELARKFVELHDDTKRLHGICSKYADLNKAAFRTGVAYLSMEVISQYFFPEKEQEQVSPEGSDISPKSMTRTGPVRLIINQLAILGIVIEDSPRLSYNPDTSFLVPSYQIDRTVYIYVWITYQSKMPDLFHLWAIDI